MNERSMRFNNLRPFLLTLLAHAASLAAFGQGYWVQVAGTVLPCTPPLAPITILSVQGTQPQVNTTVIADTSCAFSYLVYMSSANGFFQISMPCGGGTSATELVSYVANVFDTTTVSVTLNCVPLDCEGVPNGPDLPGTPCDDNNPITVNDTWDANCDCVGSVPGACDAGFWPIQAYFIDSVTGDPIPLFNEVWLIDQSTSAAGAVACTWDFGDGTTSTDAQPTHVYGGPGPYTICLAITDTSGCTDQYCDSVMVDADGLLNGLVGDDGARNGFTIRVVDPLTVSVPEVMAPTDVRLWPVPGTDRQQLAFLSATSGAARLELFAMDGRVLGMHAIRLDGGANSVEVPLTDLPSGPFLIRLTADGWALHRHSMKQ